MLRVLTLATLFPNHLRPTLGVFVERQTRALAAQPGVEVRVVAPVGLPVWPLSLHLHYAPLRGLPLVEERNGLKVHRPRYRVWPKLGTAGTARRMAAALLPALEDLRADFPFDVIDAEFFWPDGPAAALLAKELDVPFSIKARGSDIHIWGARPDIGRQIAAAARTARGSKLWPGASRSASSASARILNCRDCSRPPMSWCCPPSRRVSPMSGSRRWLAGRRS